MVASSQSTNFPSRQIRWWLSTAIVPGILRRGYAKYLNGRGRRYSSGELLGLHTCARSKFRPFGEPGASGLHSFGESRIRLPATAPFHKHVAAHGDELGGATGEREDRCGVRIADGCGARDVDSEGGEV